MRREVPQDVDVRLHQAKVDPDRVNELHLADCPPRISSRIRCTAGV